MIEVHAVQSTELFRILVTLNLFQGPALHPLAVRTWMLKQVQHDNQRNDRFGFDRGDVRGDAPGALLLQLNRFRPFNSIGTPLTHHRQRDPRGEAAFDPVDQGDLAAMRLGGGLDDRQAEADSAGGAVA